MSEIAIPADAAPLTPAEMGRRGALKRWAKKGSVDVPRYIEFSVDGKVQRLLRRVAKEISAELTARVDQAGWVPWRNLARLHTTDPLAYIDKHWLPRLVREWEQLLEQAKARNDLGMVREALVAMTALTRLSPLRHKADDSASAPLPSSVDLSHLSDDDIAAATGRPMLTLAAPKKTSKTK